MSNSKAGAGPPRLSASGLFFRMRGRQDHTFERNAAFSRIIGRPVFDRILKKRPDGRSVWADRARLGVAHLALTITPATANHQIGDRILLSSANRHDDRYIEVHVYGEISWQSLSKVTLEKALTDPQDQDDWLFGRIKLATRGVAIVDRVHP